ncbi:MAG: ABC transporter permease, partial [Saprospiraceae bacterium]
FYQKATTDFDSTEIVVNQTAVEIMNMTDPVGQQVQLGDFSFTIVGVMQDFHSNSMHENIRPLMVFNFPARTNELAIRYKSGTTETTLQQLQSTYNKFVSNYPLQYEFLDRNYEKLYRSELIISTLARYFALIAIFISGLGLFGLVTFMAEQKTKEIGIRKVLGASVANIVTLLSKDFLQLVVLASVIAIPIAWYMMTQWLDNFAYHIEIQWAAVIIAVLSAIGIAVLTVSFQGIRAALANPIEALKDD